MGGLFAIASKGDCAADLFYGTDYHSHLGTRRGGLAVLDDNHIHRYIHDISNAQFRSKFEEDIRKLSGRRGIGAISDYDDQPLIIRSHLGTYAIVTVGIVNNAAQLAGQAYKGRAHFAEMGGGEINQTELVATVINQEATFAEGLRSALNVVEGSISILLLTDQGIFAARDQLGRTPVVIGQREGAWAATMETCALPNLGFEIDRYLGPGEIVQFTEDGIRQCCPPGERMQICAFLWVYYGYPASAYEGINVEATRYRCGALLARNDNVQVDCVAGIPDSGVAHAIGYANTAGVPYSRPYVKYTPTWPRSFMPTDQRVRNLVARMKLIPIRELIEGKRILFAEDSIVRGTQLQDTIRRLYEAGAREVHMRPACPPLVHGCKFLNFSRSRSVLDLAGRTAIKQLEGRDDAHLDEYADASSGRHCAMVECIRERLHLTSLRYQTLADLVEAIGLPKEKLCTYCWDGAE
jgi:amidophosphoribosyltransferase